MRRIAIAMVAAMTFVLPGALAAQLGTPAPAQQQQQWHMQGKWGPGMCGMRGRGMWERGMRGEGMQGRGWMMGPGFGFMHTGPAMLLSLRETLHLSDTQVQRLKALEEQTRDTVESSFRAAQKSWEQAQRAMAEPKPDLSAHEQALRQAASYMVMAGQAMARAQVDAGQVLNDDQKRTLDTVMAAIREMHEGAQRGMGERRHRKPGQGPPRGGPR